MQSLWLLGIVTALQAGQGGWLLYEGRYAAATILAGYALAGVGLIWSLR